MNDETEDRKAKIRAVSELPDLPTTVRARKLATLRDVLLVSAVVLALGVLAFESYTDYQGDNDAADQSGRNAVLIQDLTDELAAAREQLAVEDAAEDAEVAIAQRADDCVDYATAVNLTQLGQALVVAITYPATDPRRAELLAPFVDPETGSYYDSVDLLLEATVSLPEDCPPPPPDAPEVNPVPVPAPVETVPVG